MDARNIVERTISLLQPLFEKNALFTIAIILSFVHDYVSTVKKKTIIIIIIQDIPSWLNLTENITSLIKVILSLNSWPLNDAIVFCLFFLNRKSSFVHC